MMRLNKLNVLLLMLLPLLMFGCASTSHNTENYDLVANADKAYENGDFRSAELAYMELVHKMPNDPYAYFKLGNTFANQHKFDEALQAYYETLRRDETYIKAYNNIATVYLLKAEFSLQAAINNFPDDHQSAIAGRAKLNELRKISRMSLTEVASPAANYKSVKVFYGSAQ